MDGIGTGIDFSEILANGRVEKGQRTGGDIDEKSAREAAQDFEAFFLTQMLETMFAEVKPDAVFGGGQAEKIYRSFMLDEYGKMMAKSGGIGVADKVMETLLREQEATNNNTKGIL